MPLETRRLSPTRDASLALEVAQELAPASTLMWHLESLNGLQVIAKKSWALTDDFEAYFLFRNRLYLMQTPVVDVWILQFGATPDESGFAEIEAAVQRFPSWKYALSVIPIAKYFFLPFNPSKEVLSRYGISFPERSPQGDNGAA
ncbi:hypothetical protein [Niveibacterium microcysteis]|uniref:Uncharacterized protein n=1 Tax=Niveibacterium microcysteis TaxID=2811415 RepID=A0ABX7MAZ1_9RHOO|nr:hypothetical protein [Niveibacterium microcysteis]QSI76652.1 hypothetical protein JY500_19675 [Niveibacterium microcysteis]